MTPTPFATPDSVDGAVAALAELGPGATPLAGGTWLMREGLDGRPVVALGRIAALRAVAASPDATVLGSGLTHADVAAAAGSVPALGALAEAAGRSANPGVRRLATLGGNLAAADFAAADLATALLALDAEVETATADGPARTDVASYLARRPAGLLTRVHLPGGAATRRSAHARLTLRAAGEYPVAIVSLAADLTPDGRLAAPCIAVGAVEAAPRRWTALEAAATDRPLDPDDLHALAETHLSGWDPREGPDAPALYRLAVLPVLVERAARTLLPQFAEA